MSLPSEEELLAYADELLAPAAASQVESLLRNQPDLRQKLYDLLAERDQGQFSIGDVWRHHRLSCPSRTELGLFLVEALKKPLGDYVQFHLQEVGCVYCQAELDEMQESMHHSQQTQEEQQRRDSLFVSSAGLLKPQKNDP